MIIQGTQQENKLISFTLDDGSFNNAAWTILSDRPAELAGLRKSMLQMSMQEFSGMTL